MLICDSKNHLKKDCPENDEGQGKRKFNREDNRNHRDDSNFAKQKEEKDGIPTEISVQEKQRQEI